MRYKLVIKEEAVRDMTEAFEWYEDKRKGLGSEFLDEVDLYFGSITKKPAHYQQHSSVRVAVLRRFPYKIVYEVDGVSIIVYAVFHTRRNPEELIKRK